MKKITENDIENLAIDLLKKQGYQYFFGPDRDPGEEQAFRKSYEEVLLSDKLRSAINRLNPDISHSAREDAFNQIKRIHSEQLIAGNEDFHQKLTGGVNVIIRKKSESRGDYVRLIDFQNPDNNDFCTVNQFTVIENQYKHRADIVLFVNGLPLAVMELKNPRDEKATIQSAYKQLQTYKENIPALFTYNSILVISDGLEAKAGSLSSGIDRFMSWKSIDGKREARHNVGQLETLIKGMFNKKTFLDIIRYFITFEKGKKENLKTGAIHIETIKKLAAYHQYYASNKALESVLQASSESGSRKGGVIWHTQGSGKSLTMVFSVGKIVQKLNNPTIVVITDRNDLDDQLFDTFAASKTLLRQEPVQAKNREHLKELLKVVSGGIVFTTIQKFHPENGSAYEELSDRKNIVVIADEAHRSQYGFKAKTIDEKDKKGQVVGKKTVYGFAKYMREALPHATYLGFTGTPVEGTDKNTPAVFGNYVDVYDIAQAVEDKATVPISYESRLAKIKLSQKGKELIKNLDQELEEKEMSEAQKTRSKMTQLESIIGSEDRIKHIAQDIVAHFEKRQSVFKGKGMIVTMSRRIATNLYNEIIKLRSEWHSKDLSKGSIKIVMTSSASDGPELFKYHTSKEQRRSLADRMRDPEDELCLVIVVDMWLTGFDVPCLHTLYIDKLMKGHNLMQAIARVNRIYEDKPGGLVVDYLGIASNLKRALSFYSKSGGRGAPAVPQEQAVSLMLEKLEIISQMFHGFNYKPYFTADTRKKLSLILEAEEHILSLENGKERFIDQVTALSKVFALSIPNETAMKAKDEVAFFQAVKARLVKFTGIGAGKDKEIETVIRQVIDEALVAHKVVDVFSASGIKKPDISILSDEFLLEIKNMKHKNIAIETLKKILNDEIKGREKKNIIQGKSLMDMLEKSIKKYHNQAITSAEVIEELITIAKDIQSADEEPKKMSLSDEEYAFYTAVADNESAYELMGKEQLRELAIVLTDKIRKNATIDWQIKENIRAKIRVMVKRTLREYGYPPDRERLAVDNVLKQAERIADEISKN